MKTVAFVPIKLNSERLKNKNIMPFHNGKPLIEYILDTLGACTEIDEKYVFCSDDSIQQYLPKSVRYQKRSKRLDSSSVRFNEVLISFAEVIDADIYVLTHATAPFISADSIDEGIRKVKSGMYDSALSVVKKQEFMWRDGKPFNYDVQAIPRTQDLEPIYFETCGLYVYTKETIVEKKRRIGDKPFLIEVSQVEACDINTQEDFIIADALFNYAHDTNYDLR